MKTQQVGNYHFKLDAQHKVENGQVKNINNGKTLTMDEVKKAFTQVGKPEECRAPKDVVEIRNQHPLTQPSKTHHHLSERKYDTKVSDSKIKLTGTVNHKLLDKTDMLYVVGLKGKVYISGSHDIDGTRMTHNRLHTDNDGVGKKVLCAGHLKLQNGKITAIDNRSGHYRPSTEHYKAFKQFLKDANVLNIRV